MGSRVLWAYSLALLAFLVAPILVVIFTSFNAGEFITFPPKGLSLRWYVRVFEYEAFVRSIVTSAELAVLATLGSILLGLPASIVLVRYPIPGRDLLFAFLLSPLTLPMIVLGVALLFTFGTLGIGLSFWPLLLGHIVVSVPYIVRTVTGVYRSVDASLEESALVLGASRWQVFRLVTLPLLRPGLLAGSIFSILTSFDNIAVSVFLTSAETTTLPVTLLSYLVYNFDPSVSAVTTLQLLVVVAGLFVAERIHGLRELSL